MRKAFLIVLLTCSWRAPAFAETLDAQTRRTIYEEARAALKSGQLSEAARLFQELWHEKRTYDVAFNLAEIEVKLGNHRAAAEHISFGLRNTPPREELAFTERFSAVLAAAKQHIGTVEISVEPPGAHIFVDEVFVGAAPLEGAVYVDPGPHEIRVELDGYVPVRHPLEARAGQDYPVEIQLDAESQLEAGLPPAAPLAPPTAEERPATSSAKRAVVLGTAALAVTGLAAGTYFAIERGRIDRHSRRLRATLEGGGQGACIDNDATECGALESNAKRGDRARDRAAAGLVAGGALAVGAILAWVLWPEPSSSATAWRATPLTGGRGSEGGFWGVELSGAF